MWELDHKGGWVPKNWCFWIVVLEKTLESLFNSKEIKPVNPKGNQPWLLIERTNAEAEAPIFWPPDTNSYLNVEDPGWQRMKWLVSISDSVNMNLGQTLGESEGQGGLICCIWSHHFMANRWGNSGNSGWLYFSGLPDQSRWWLQPWN